MTESPQGTETLHTVSEAAAMLGVSPVSIRRWSNQGKLSCLRVGSRNERRFRRQDIDMLRTDLALTGSDSACTQAEQPANGSRETDAAAAPGTMRLEGLSIAEGSHLCSLYESDLGRLKLAVPFLANGLREGATCYLVGSAGPRSAILAALSENGVDVDKALKRSQLIPHGGATGADAMCDYFCDEFVRASGKGSPSIRVLGDMAWFLDKGMDVNELRTFELRYNCEIARHFPVVSLCQYDVRRFSGIAVLTALKCHGDTFDYPASRFLGI